MKSLADPTKFVKLLFAPLKSKSSPPPAKIVFHIFNLFSTLLSVASLLGDLTFAEAAVSTTDSVEGILNVLEKGDNPPEVVTFAAKSLFYMTDPALHEKDGGRSRADSSASASSHDAPPNVARFPFGRAIACTLENVTSPSLPLQRWSAAGVRNLLLLDGKTLKGLVDVGGILVLASLLTSGDADTQAHAAR